MTSPFISLHGFSGRNVLIDPLAIRVVISMGSPSAEFDAGMRSWIWVADVVAADQDGNPFAVQETPAEVEAAIVAFHVLSGREAGAE